jgi:tetratricopeptide (TPR) repeat protein
MNKTRFILIVIALISIIGAALPAFANDPCDPSVNYIKLGNAQYAQGQFDAAVASFTCVAEQHPDSAAAFNGRGNANRNLGNYAEAIKDYSKAIERQGDYAIAYNNRGWAYYNLAQYDKALADYNRALELDPNLAYAYNNRGLIYQIRGKNDLAAADYNRAIDLHLTPVTWAQHNLKVMQFGTPNVIQGSSQITAAVTTPITPNLDALLSQGEAAYEQHDFTLAVQQYTQVIASAPDNVSAYYLRGRAYIGLDQFPEALSDFNELVELNPDFTYAYWERSIVYAEVGQFDLARADAARAAKADPDHVNNLIVGGTLAKLSGDQAEAGKQFKALLDRLQIQRTNEDKMQPGDTVTVQMTAGSVFAIPLDGKAGQTISAYAESDLADPVVVLLDPNGAPLSGDDDSCNGLNAMISKYALPSDGTYTLLIGHAGGGSFGAINVTLTAESSPQA